MMHYLFCNTCNITEFKTSKAKGLRWKKMSFCHVAVHFQRNFRYTDIMFDAWGHITNNEAGLLQYLSKSPVG